MACFGIALLAASLAPWQVPVWIGLKNGPTEFRGKC